MKRMNLAIVGGQKCGTTALADFISQHPDIFLVNGKEAHVFDSPDIDSITEEVIEARYSQLIKGYEGEPIVCDATPIYSYWPDIPARLASYNPDMKIIFLVRDPVDRAVSQYFMEKGRGAETLGILPAFLAERWRVNRGRGDRSQSSSWRHHSYLDRGFFSKQLANLESVIPAENLLLLNNNELREAHAATMEKVFSFIGVANRNIPKRVVFEGKYENNSISVRVARLYAGWRLKAERKFVQKVSTF